MKEKGILCQVHYIPIYNFLRTNYKLGCKMTNTEEYYRTCVSIPIYPDLKKKQLKYIVENIKQILGV